MLGRPTHPALGFRSAKAARSIFNLVISVPSKSLFCLRGRRPAEYLDDRNRWVVTVLAVVHYDNLKDVVPLLFGRRNERIRPQSHLSSTRPTRFLSPKFVNNRCINGAGNDPYIEPFRDLPDCVARMRIEDDANSVQVLVYVTGCHPIPTSQHSQHPNFPGSNSP